MTPLQILGTIAGYAALLYVVARWAARHSDNRTFFTGGRRMAWWVVALGMIGAPMSGVSFVSVPGQVASDAFSYMQMVAGFTVGQVVIAYGLVPLFYRLKVTSLYEYLDSRFGLCSHRTGALLFLLSKSLLTALKLFVICEVMQQLVCTPLGIPYWANVTLSVGLVWAYTHHGGVRSVVWTDILQTLCLVGAVVGAIAAIISYFDMSASTIFELLNNDPRSQILVTDDPLSIRTLGKMFWGGVFILIAMTGLDQDMMQRNLSCPTARDSQRNILLTALAQGVVIYLLLVLGLLLDCYAKASGGAITATDDGLFAAVAVQGGLPLWVGVLFILGLVSSTWSTAGSALTALTTSTIYDWMPERVGGDECELKRLRGRVHTLLALLIGVLILLFGYLSSERVIDLLYRVVSYTYGPILGLFAFGMLTRRRPHERWVAVVCLLAPALCWGLQQAALHYAGYAIGFELIIYNALLCFGGLYLISKRHE